MKNIYRYIFIVFCGLAFPACMNIEEQLAEELVEIRFTATTEDHAYTKTTLEGELGGGTHQVLWSPEDEIAIIPVGVASSLTSYPFKNTSAERTQTAVFEGKAANAETYYAFYPASNVGNATSSKVEFTLPNTLTYQAGSFTDGSFPMAAKVEAGKDISFNNLCGLLALRLTGKETIKSITFISNNDKMVAGLFSVDMYDGEWKMTPAGNNKRSIVMDCGPEGVTLNESEPTIFYFILPPQTYDGFDIQIMTADGGMMCKHAEKPLKIKRSVLTPAGTLSYVESYGIDLSARGTANCYIVPPTYSAYIFDCTVKGNSNEAVGNAASAEVIWETKNTTESVSLGEIIPSVELLEGKVKFMLPEEPVPGNALIAVKNSADKILWSWHIWVTDNDPDETAQSYPSGAMLMDRHLGALSAASEDPLTNGLLYQWGRKDPFIGYVDSKDDLFALTAPADACSQVASDGLDYQYSVEHPTEFILGDYTWCEGGRWASVKTMYDPCPAGWRVPDGGTTGVWAGTTKDIYIHLSTGMTLKSTSPEAYYPTCGYVDRNGNGDSETFYGWVWTCTLDKNDTKADSYPYAFLVSSFSNGSVQLEHRRHRGDGYSVRCMKEDSSDKTGDGDDYIVDDEYEW